EPKRCVNFPTPIPHKQSRIDGGRGLSCFSERVGKSSPGLLAEQTAIIPAESRASRVGTGYIPARDMPRTSPFRRESAKLSASRPRPCSRRVYILLRREDRSPDRSTTE